LVKVISQCPGKEYDVIILSGGISMGKKFDFTKHLRLASVKKLFIGVQQRPGKPFGLGNMKTIRGCAFPAASFSNIYDAACIVSLLSLFPKPRWVSSTH